MPNSPLADGPSDVAPPVRMSGTPGSVRRPAPLLGEHTDEVLRERLGMSGGELNRLRELGVIGSGQGAGPATAAGERR